VALKGRSGRKSLCGQRELADDWRDLSGGRLLSRRRRHQAVLVGAPDGAEITLENHGFRLSDGGIVRVRVRVRGKQPEAHELMHVSGVLDGSQTYLAFAVDEFPESEISSVQATASSPIQVPAVIWYCFSGI
jgi:hypothetical protein